MPRHDVGSILVTPTMSIEDNLIRAVRDAKRRGVGSPIHEYCRDIGAREDYERAKGAYRGHFRGDSAP